MKQSSLPKAEEVQSPPTQSQDYSKRVIQGQKSQISLLQQLKERRLRNEKHRKRRMIENYNLYAIHLCMNNYLPDFTKGYYWKKMAASLIPYGEVLSEDNIEIRLCDTFQQGMYDPQRKKILLCANVLFEKTMFEFAMKRFLIQYFDKTRGGGDYNFTSCKHLACTEIRAAVQHPLCDKFLQQRMFKSASQVTDTDICVQKKAIQHLEERPFCRVKAKEYVQYSYHKCIQDTAPYGTRAVSPMTGAQKIH